MMYINSILWNHQSHEKSMPRMEFRHFARLYGTSQCGGGGVKYWIKTAREREREGAVHRASVTCNHLQFAHDLSSI